MISGIELSFSLLNNLAIFIALVSIYGCLIDQLRIDSLRIDPIEKTQRRKRQVAFGLFFGVFAVICMYAGTFVSQGPALDQRNTVITLSGAFGGPLSALVSAFFAAGFHAHMGTDGMLPGITGIMLSAVAGMLLNRFSDCFGGMRKAGASALIATLLIFPGVLFAGGIHTGRTMLNATALPYGLSIYSFSDN